MRTDILVIANTPSPNTHALALAVYDGACDNSLGASLTVRYLSPLTATAAEVLATRAIIIGTTENFGYMSGQIKDFFERIYEVCLEKTPALPWALYIRAGRDGTGTNKAVHSIVGALRWREVQPPLCLVGAYQPTFVLQCREFGMTVAAGLVAGLY